MSFLVERPTDRFCVRASVLDARFDMVEDAHMAHPTLLVFVRAVSKKLPHVKFAPVLNTRRRLWVYDPHQTYVLGMLLYDEINEKYGVEARNIENLRYGSGHSQYHQLWSKNIDTAVKKVAANLQPWSVGEFASLGVRAYSLSRDTEINEAETKRNILRDKVGIKGNNSPAYIYLKSQINNNVRLGDQEFHDNVRELVDTQDYLSQLRQDGVTPKFVYGGTDRHGRQYLDSATINTEYAYSRVQVDHIHPRVYEGEPEFDALVSKLAVLNMAEPDHYVRGVGMKHASDMFYVSG